MNEYAPGADENYEPEHNEPDDARPWLQLIEDAEDAFDKYHVEADRIDKLYANLERLSTETIDREFQLFWANAEVLKPSIYARPPVAVVTPKFKDRRPLYQTASELLERAANVGFERQDIDGVMRLIRDDLAVVGRGVMWCRYETTEGNRKKHRAAEKVCFEHKDRRDFLHDPARNWNEVTWVAAASYMTRKQVKKRFGEKAAEDAEYIVNKEAKEVGGGDNRERAKVWEIWHREENKVVWVTQGCQDVLESDKPHLDLEGFWPCPKPAYATVQRGSLVPVPDQMFYADQLAEIDDMTNRIHSIADALKVRGFYPAGGGEIADAVEAAIANNDPGRILIPISNWAAFGSGSAKDSIIWLPIDQIVEVLRALVELRRQVIEDVYQIMGLSDIMRGATDARETLGAQQLKSQYGSVRIRDKQNELVRIARDALCIAAEIMAENFERQTLLDMAQMDIKTDAQVKQDIAGAKKQFSEKMRELMQNPQVMQQAQQNPQMAEQALKQAEQALAQQIEKLNETPTVEKIMSFLRDERIRAFALEIETDSTIQPDEQAEKQARGEFVAALSGMLPQLGQMIEAEPSTAEFAGELLKFAVGAFRVSRTLDDSIDEFVQQMKKKAGQPKPNIEQEKLKADQQKEEARQKGESQRLQLEAQIRAQEQQAKSQQEMTKIAAEREVKMLEAEGKRQENDAKLIAIREKAQADMVKHQMDMQKGQLELEKVNREMAMLDQKAQVQQVTAAQNMAMSADKHNQDMEISAQAAQVNAAKAMTGSAPGVT